MLSFNFTPLVVELGMRLDKFLAMRLAQYSRTSIKNFITAGCLLENNHTIKDPAKLVKQLEYQLTIPEAKPTHLIASSNIAFEIIYEDEDLIVVNKPAGLTVHPGAGNYQDTLVNGLIHHYENQLSSVSGKLRPGIVHRLDKNTSGLMLVAKNDYAHNFLSKQLSSRSLSRTYIALVWGTPSLAAGTISLNIARSKQDRIKMQVVTTGGKVAITHYRVLTSYLDKKISMLECKLATGRTHQIRVHLSHKGHAIIADNTYGKASLAKYNIAWFNRQALHAKKIGFIHPKSQELMEFEIALPEDMQLLISAIS